MCSPGCGWCLVPVFLIALFAGDGHETPWRIAAFVIFAVAVITDRFDGALARSYGMGPNSAGWPTRSPTRP